MSLTVKDEFHQTQQTDVGSSDLRIENENTNQNNNSGNSPKPQQADGAASTATAAANATESGAQGGNKASGDISSCLQSSLEQMQQRFQEMVDLILNKLDDMNGQIEELEKILLETVQRSGQQLPAAAD